jgi:hypothetical protein
MAAAFISAAWRTRFVMDEFAQVQSARFLVRSPLYHGVDPIKTVLATELFSSATGVASSITMVRICRMIGLSAATTSLLLLYRVAKALWPSAGSAMLVPLTALSFSNVFERAFRIRTDTVALPFALAALVLLVRPGRAGHRTALAGVFLGAAFLSTQKAIYFLAAFLVALVVAEWSTTTWRRSLRDGGLLLSGWCASFLAYAIWFGGKHWMQVVNMVLVGPAYILSGSATYSGLRMFITQTLERNAVPYGLCFTGLLVTSKHWRRLTFPERLAAVTTMLVVACIFAHDQPWPYVFVWAQVFLALWVLPLLVWARARVGWLSQRTAVLALALLAALALPRQARYFSHTNKEQLEVMAQSERLLEPGSQYFDGVGMVADRRIAGTYPNWWWDAPNLSRMIARLRKGDDRIPQEILADHPKLWILNYRLDSVAGLVKQMIADGYVRVSPLILLTGVDMGAGVGERDFSCRWPGRYQLFDQQGLPVKEPISVDGTPGALFVDIVAGRHRLSRPDPKTRRFLLPAGTDLPGPFAPEGPAPDLYAEVYTF